MNDLSIYNQHRHLMKSGDLLTYRTNGIISTLIHIWSKDNHAGLVLAPKEFEGEENRRWTLEAIGSGVRTAYLSAVLEHVNGEVYWHQLKPEYDSLRNEIVSFALQHTGCTKYDFISLVKNIFGLVSADMNKLFCSEYVFLSWKSVDIVSGDTAPRPSGLAELGVTLPPILIVKSKETGPAPVITP